MAPVIRALKWLDYLADHFIWVARLTIICAMLVVAWFAADREPPFAIISVDPAEARPGDWVTLTADVRRDVHRKCAANMSRFLFDSGGRIYDLGSAVATAETISAIERKTPGRMVLAIQLPEAMGTGPAELVSSLEYQCNRVHKLWPIQVTTHIPFTVLP